MGTDRRNDLRLPAERPSRNANYHQWYQDALQKLQVTDGQRWSGLLQYIDLKLFCPHTHAQARACVSISNAVCLVRFMASWET